MIYFFLPMQWVPKTLHPSNTLYVSLQYKHKLNQTVVSILKQPVLCCGIGTYFTSTSVRVLHPASLFVTTQEIGVQLFPSELAENHEVTLRHGKYLRQKSGCDTNLQRKRRKTIFRHCKKKKEEKKKKKRQEHLAGLEHNGAAKCREM